MRGEFISYAYPYSALTLRGYQVTNITLLSMAGVLFQATLMNATHWNETKHVLICLICQRERGDNLLFIALVPKVL